MIEVLWAELAAAVMRWYGAIVNASRKRQCQSCLSQMWPFLNLLPGAAPRTIILAAVRKPQTFLWHRFEQGHIYRATLPGISLNFALKFLDNEDNLSPSGTEHCRLFLVVFTECCPGHLAQPPASVGPKCLSLPIPVQRGATCFVRHSGLPQQRYQPAAADL